MKKWESGKDNEIGFWREYLKKHGKQYETPREGDPRFYAYIELRPEITIANVGAGAVNMIGEIWKDVKVTVVASDLLADKYYELYKEARVMPYTAIKKEDMTNLSYSDNTFDIVYCANALDHCQDPKKAIKEMVRVCRKGGFVVLHHMQHEAKRQNYHGLHQWNIDLLSSGDCLFWLKGEGNFLLSDVVRGFRSEFVPARTAHKVTSVYQKPL